MWKIALSVVMVLFIFVTTAAVEATPLDVRVDVNNQPWDVPTGTTFVEPIGWNVIAYSDLNNTTKVHDDLTDFNTGVDTDLTLQITEAFYASSSNWTDVEGWSSPTAPWVVDTVLRDYAMVYPGGGVSSSQITLGELEEDKVYQIELLSVRNAAGLGVFTLTDSAGARYDDTGYSGAWSARTHGLNEKRVMRWANVFVDASGQVVIDVDYSSTYAFLSGMRVSELPEPSTFMLALGLFVIGLGTSRPSRIGNRHGGNRG